jgi:predicted metal-dependent enzyme (double-stranded beta helix superfamily)
MEGTQKRTHSWYRGYGVSVLLVLAAVLTLGGCTGDDTGDAANGEAEPADDLAAVNSEYAATPFETDYAHVHSVDLPAGEMIAPHEGGARVIYSLNDYTLEFETDGNATEKTLATGDVHFHESGVHSVNNTGDQPAQFMAFERIDAPLPDTTSGDETLDAVTLPDGATHEVLLDNDQVTVHRLALEPGTELPPHFGYNRIIYALSDYTVTFIDPANDERTEKSLSEGDLHDHEAGMHAVENTGDQPAEYIVVGFKQ